MDLGKDQWKSRIQVQFNGSWLFYTIQPHSTTGNVEDPPTITTPHFIAMARKTLPSIDFKPVRIEYEVQ